MEEAPPEHHLWGSDRGGWTYCRFDSPCDLSTAARLHKGSEDDRGRYVFRTLIHAVAALQELDIFLETCPELASRSTTVYVKQNTKVVLEIGKEPRDPKWIEGWAPKNKFTWQHIIHLEIDAGPDENKEAPDSIVKYVISDMHEVGYALRTQQGWVFTRSTTTQKYLTGMHTNKEAIIMLAQAIGLPWKIVSKPFQPEFPGNREWNLGAAQLRCMPREGEHPNWDRIFDHLGQDLDGALSENPWAVKHGVLSGADWLRMWVAFVLRFPEKRLPYIFLYSQMQNTGKSILHEAISHCLVERGVVMADTALSTGFNGEIKNAVICIVEEKNLKYSKDAYNKIKNWTTAPRISIHIKNMTPYDQTNYTHWIQTGNRLDECPIAKGDTRIVLIHTQVLEEDIPKTAFLSSLKEEAPAILYTLMNLFLPESEGRMALPTVTTALKAEQMDANQSELEKWLKLHIHVCNGSSLPLYQVWQAFLQDLPDRRRGYWPEAHFRRMLPDWLIRAQVSGTFSILNYTFEIDKEPEHWAWYRDKKGHAKTTDLAAKMRKAIWR